MNPAARRPHRIRNAARRALPALAALFAIAAAASPLFSQTSPETIGRIEGNDIAVKGAVGVEVESGRSTTVLASGADVTVRTGQAWLLLADGGVIGICAPAHLSLLKSGGAITLALDYGRIHVQADAAIPLTIYTPLILATPASIGGAPRDVTLGLESDGSMCIRAARGAVRIEQQLTAQSLLVPQNGEITLVGGQLDALRNAAGSCQCDVAAAQAIPPLSPRPAEISLLAAPPPTEPKKPAPPPEKKEQVAEKAPAPVPEVPVGSGQRPGPPAKEEPIYKVMMPPLTFDASQPVPPPPPSPETLVLVRQVRARPAVVARGRVEEPPAPVFKPAPPPVQVATVQEAPAKKDPGVMTRIKNFFRRISSRGPCAGVGCG